MVDSEYVRACADKCQDDDSTTAMLLRRAADVMDEPY